MLFLLLLPLLILLPSLGQFVYQPGSSYSDLAISHYPNAVFLLNSLKSGQGIPLWSPAILSGYPFAANPLSGLWYLPGWLALLFPLPLGFNLVVAAHLLFGGFGTYLWLRSIGLKPWASLAGALVFETMPKLLAHFAAGHLTLVYAVAWTPWLLLAEGAWRRRRGWLCLWRAPGLVLGLIFLADVRWAAFAGILWVGYRWWGALSNRLGPAAGLKNTGSNTEGEESPLPPLSRGEKTASPPLIRGGKAISHPLIRGGKAISHPLIGGGKAVSPPLTRGAGGDSLLTTLADFLLQLILALLISAPLLLPLAEYTRLSTRSSLTPAEAFTLSLPPSRLLGLVFPDPGGYAEWVLYPGALGLVLTGVILFSPRLRRASRFWLWAALAALIFSLGSAIPFLPELARLPGISLLRVPPRALFVMGFAIAALVAFSVDALLEPDPGQDFSLRTGPTLFLAALSGFVIFFAAGVMVLTGTLPFNFAWGAICLLAAALLTGLRLRNRMASHPLAGRDPAGLAGQPGGG